MSGSVKVVTLVHMSLPRIGATSQGAFAFQKKSYEGTRVVEDAEVETIRKEVESVARQNGESALNLQSLEQMHSNYSNPKKKLEFQLNLSSLGIISASPPYATCEMETALEIDGRYFKVEEIKI